MEGDRAREYNRSEHVGEDAQGDKTRRKKGYALQNMDEIEKCWSCRSWNKICVDTITSMLCFN